VKRKTQNLRNPTETKQDKKKEKTLCSKQPSSKQKHHQNSHAPLRQEERMQLNSNSNQSLMINAYHDNINLCLRTSNLQNVKKS
jgi:hypothetical protein